MLTHSTRYEQIMMKGFCEAEPWKAAHDDAMRVRDLEEFIPFAVSVFQYLQQREARAYKVTSEDQWDEVDEEFARLFADWHTRAQAAEVKAQEFIEQGFDIDGIEQLREAISQAAPYAEALAMPSASGDLAPLTNAELLKIADAHQPPEWWHEGEDA